MAKKAETIPEGSTFESPEDKLRTLCSEEQKKLQALISKAHTLEQQRDAIASALNAAYNEITAQRGYVSGLRVALGELPLPNSVPQ